MPLPLLPMPLVEGLLAYAPCGTLASLGPTSRHMLQLAVEEMAWRLWGSVGVPLDPRGGRPTRAEYAEWKRGRGDVDAALPHIAQAAVIVPNEVLEEIGPPALCRLVDTSEQILKYTGEYRSILEGPDYYFKKPSSLAACPICRHGKMGEACEGSGAPGCELRYLTCLDCRSTLILHLRGCARTRGGMRCLTRVISNLQVPGGCLLCSEKCDEDQCQNCGCKASSKCCRIRIAPPTPSMRDESPVLCCMCRSTDICWGCSAVVDLEEAVRCLYCEEGVYCEECQHEVLLRGEMCDECRNREQEG